MNTKTLPYNLTSYDLFKNFAVLVMIVDHVGYYFFPEDMWWRAVGRLSAPVWLFLIGYARSRDFSPKLLGGAGILVLASGVFGPSILPMNILVNIIFIRYVIDRMGPRMLSSFANYIEGVVALIVLAIPTAFITDYGLAGFMVAVFGLAMRRHQDNQPMFKDAVPLAGLAAFVLFFGLAFISFEFTDAQRLFVFLGMGIAFFALAAFRGKEYPALTLKMPKFMTMFLQFCGRRSLEIYVGHLLIFKIAATLMGLEHHELWSWNILS
jgi:hypothetical protein